MPVPVPNIRRSAIGYRSSAAGPPEEIEALFKARGLIGLGSDPLLDLVEAQAQRMVEEGGERRTRRRYVVWATCRAEPLSQAR